MHRPDSEIRDRNWLGDLGAAPLAQCLLGFGRDAEIEHRQSRESIDRKPQLNQRLYLETLPWT